jgi:hypothetical protein
MFMKLITFASLMMFTMLFFTVNNVMAQQVVNEAVKEQVQETAKDAVSTQTLPMDITTITGILGTAGGLLWKDRKDKQDLEKQMKEGMDILMNYVACDVKIHNASIVYPEKTHSQLLQLKVNNNAMENQTIAGEMAVQINRLQKFLMVNFSVPMPNMSIPTERVINATTTVPANKVEQIKTTNDTTNSPKPVTP